MTPAEEEKFLDNSRYIVNNPVEAKMVQHPSEWPWSSFRATRGLEKVPGYLETAFLLRQFSSSRKKAQMMYEDFVLAGIGMESPLLEAKKQIFLGSDSFIAEAMQHVNENDDFNNVPKVQKHANRPSLENIFSNTKGNSKEHRNHHILIAHDIHAYTQREIGKHLGLHPGYISNIVLKLRKD